MLKPFLLLSAAVLFVIAPIPTPTLAASGSPQDSNTAKPTAAVRDKAREVYKVDCAICHGDNGNGKTDLATSMQLTLADWTDPKALSGSTDKDLFNIIRKGKGDKMPSEDASRAKDEDVWALIAYIRGFSKGQPAAPTPAPAPADAPPAPPSATPPPANPGK